MCNVIIYYRFKKVTLYRYVLVHRCIILNIIMYNKVVVYVSTHMLDRYIIYRFILLPSIVKRRPFLRSTYWCWAVCIQMTLSPFLQYNVGKKGCLLHYIINKTVFIRNHSSYKDSTVLNVASIRRLSLPVQFNFIGKP